MVSVHHRPVDDPAANAALLLIRIGLAVLAFAVPLSAVGSRRALFTLLFVGGGLLIVAATLLPRPPVERRIGVALDSAVGLGGLALLAWGAVSLIWTPFPAEAASRWGKEAGTIAFVVLAAVLLPERTRTANLYLFPLGLAAAAAATAGAAFVGPEALGRLQDGDTTLERAVVGLVMLVWPALGALGVRERWASAGWLAVGVTLAAMAAWTTVALLALAAGAVAFAAATVHPRRVGRILGLVAAASILSAPALPLALGPVAKSLAATYGDRVSGLAATADGLRAWAGVVRAEHWRLITGHGFDMATRAAMTGFLPADVPRTLGFELWYELGILGALAAAAVAAGAFLAAGRGSATVAPFLLAQLVTGLCFALAGTYTTQLWWITLLGVAALAFANVIQGQYRTDRPTASVRPDLGSRREPAM